MRDPQTKRGTGDRLPCLALRAHTFCRLFDETGERNCQERFGRKQGEEGSQGVVLMGEQGLGGGHLHPLTFQARAPDTCRGCVCTRI